MTDSANYAVLLHGQTTGNDRISKNTVRYPVFNHLDIIPEYQSEAHWQYPVLMHTSDYIVRASIEYKYTWIPFPEKGRRFQSDLLFNLDISSKKADHYKGHVL